MDVKLTAFFCFVGFLCAAGCGKTETEDQKKSAGAADTAAVQTDPARLLVGTWYGRAELNQQLLDHKLASLTDPQLRQSLSQLATVFRTTEIGARFDTDGEMELDVQVNPAGQVLRDSTRGHWQVVEVEEDAVMIETTEQLPGGGTETNRLRYQFSRNGDVAYMVAPTSGQLADCQPVFVFQRVRPETGKIAERASDDSIR